MLGAILVPISTWSRPRELGYVLDHCQAETLVTVPGFGGRTSAAGRARVPARIVCRSLSRIVVAGGTARAR